MTYQTYRLTWEGIEIEARYDPKYAGGIIAHLEVEAINPERAKLPMTETGYRSHFHQVGTIEAEHNGNVVQAVTHWLNKEAQSKDWQQHLADTCQGDLFA